jgi:hypothetical protein
MGDGLGIRPCGVQSMSGCECWAGIPGLVIATGDFTVLRLAHDGLRALAGVFAATQPFRMLRLPQLAVWTLQCIALTAQLGFFQSACTHTISTLNALPRALQINSKSCACLVAVVQPIKGTGCVQAVRLCMCSSCCMVLLGSAGEFHAFDGRQCGYGRS